MSRLRSFSIGIACALVLPDCAKNDSAPACACTTDNADIAFQQNAEFTGPCTQTNQVDVNLGNSPENFVKAAYCQINGSEPPAGTVTTQVTNLTTLPFWRRVDVVNTFMTAAGRTIPRIYSDPWQSQPELLNAPCRSGSVTRDVGAVCMFFFSCPGGTNCGMDWANTHAEGMSAASAVYGFGSDSTGYYTSSGNAGFWYRELLDARYAGLSYLLPNVYGPDITDGSIANLATALAKIDSMGLGDQVKIGMFDDTSGWAPPYSTPAPWNTAPWSSVPENLSTAEQIAAADTIFNDKWKPFFTLIPSKYWYEVNGQPLIYFYNGGTLPVDGNSQGALFTIMQELKTDFQASFGVMPYVVIDIGFSRGDALVADNQFEWDSLTSTTAVNNFTSYSHNGITAAMSMNKWDPTGRDDGGSDAVANSNDGIIKDDGHLQEALANSMSANFLTLATWNDLGEGTGINRNYDYYVQGNWEPPNYFMNDIRHSQAQVACPPVTVTQ